MHLPVMVNASFQHAFAYGFEMVDAAFIGRSGAVPSIENLRHTKRFKFYANLALPKHSRFIGWWFNASQQSRVRRMRFDGDA